MLQEIRVEAIVIDSDGKKEKLEYSDEINAGYSTKKIKQFVRSDIHQKNKGIKGIVSLKVKEEAEIYGNI